MRDTVDKRKPSTKEQFVVVSHVKSNYVHKRSKQVIRGNDRPNLMDCRITCI